jgi:hypothetical protein
MVDWKGEAQDNQRLASSSRLLDILNHQIRILQEGFEKFKRGMEVGSTRFIKGLVWCWGMCRD